MASASRAFEEHFRQYGKITHFYCPHFHLPGKTCFLRVHQPERHSDLISRITLDRAAAHGKTAAVPHWGLERPAQCHVLHGAKLMMTACRLNSLLLLILRRMPFPAAASSGRS